METPMIQIREKLASTQDGTTQQCSKIPKQFHQIWFDFGRGLGTTASEKYKECTARLMKLHPDWTIHEWSYEEVKELITKRFPEFLDTWLGYDAPIKRHDSARPIILYLLGGVYLDHDFEPIKNIEPLLGQHDFVVGNEERERLGVCNAFMGSVPQNPFLKLYIENMMKVAVTKDLRPEDATGPRILNKTLIEYCKQAPEHCASFGVYHHNFLYPTQWSDKVKLIPQQVAQAFPECFLYQTYDQTWTEPAVPVDPAMMRKVES